MTVTNIELGENVRVTCDFLSRKLPICRCVDKLRIADTYMLYPLKTEGSGYMLSAVGRTVSGRDLQNTVAIRLQFWSPNCIPVIKGALGYKQVGYPCNWNMDLLSCSSYVCSWWFIGYFGKVKKWIKKGTTNICSASFEKEFKGRSALWHMAWQELCKPYRSVEYLGCWHKHLETKCVYSHIFAV
jgi:hypothetical protein